MERRMSITIGFVPRSDKEILDCIEDFLVNNFGVDEREGMSSHDAFQMLEHIANLIELRRVISNEGGRDIPNNRMRPVGGNS
jgi:hypothetical protein